MDVQRSVQPDVQTNVRDRSTAVREYVWRALLRTALGEAYDFDLVPVYVRDGNAMEVGYVVYISTPAPVPVGSRIAIASHPIEFDANEDLVGGVVESAVEALRRARSEALRTS